MKYILIGTTSLNRSCLHLDCIPEWYDYINKLDKEKYNIKWFINIDYIKNLEESVDITKQNFTNIVKDIPTIFTLNRHDGNFLNACKNISQRMNEYVLNNKLNQDDVIIFWLEDDWKLNPNNIPLQELIENYMSNLTYINLSFIRRNYIHALAPSLINYNLWKDLHFLAWKNQKKAIDPEHCVGKFYLKNFGKYDDILNITLINKFKKPKETFFKSHFLNFENSYYTYNNTECNIDINNNKNKFIEKKKIIDFTKNKVTFIRVTTSMCLDGVNYGRNFMKNYNIKKNKNNKDDDFQFYNKNIF